MSDLIQIQVKAKEAAPNVPAPALDIEQLKARVQSSTGKEYWRSLEELSGHPDFTQLMAREFPTAPRDMAPLSRRDFVKLMGAAMALAGLSGCAFQPQEKIVPYVKQPDDIVPGIPQFYATAFNFGGFAQGVLAESNMGRPTKIEGNPDHPESGRRPGGGAATDIWMQSYVLDLYDPARSQNVLKNGAVATWDEFLGVLNDKAESLARTGGAGLRLLTGTVTSPTLLEQIASMKQRFPQAQWHHYEPVSWDNIYEGARLATGAAAQPLYDLTKASVILSLDANFLYDEPGHLAMARDWAAHRVVRKANKNSVRMNRTYMAESAPTVTGIKAEHRMRMRSSQIEGFARAVAAQLGVTGFSGTTLPDGVDAKAVSALVADLRAAGNGALVMAGYAQPASVHAIAHAINARLGAIGSTVRFVEPVVGAPIVNGARVTQAQSIKSLVDDMKDGKVDTLLIVGGNPCYDAPADVDFLGALKGTNVPTRIHLSAYEDETSGWCHWHVPESHSLEAWSDLRSYDGTASIVQPLIEPLYPATRNVHEVIAPLTNNPLRGSYDIVRSTYLKQAKQGSPIGTTGAYSGQGDLAFESRWQTIIHNGVVPNTAARPVIAAVRGNVAGSLTPAPALTVGNGTFELILRPDPSVWDGRYANNAWLQELPKPLSKLTWDNAALMSIQTSLNLGLDSESMVSITMGTKTLTVPVHRMPGVPEDTIVLYLGYGRTRGGPIGGNEEEQVGFDAYPLRNSSGLWHSTVQAKPASGSYQLSTLR